MVTLQEIEEREKELSAIEMTATEISRTPLLQRRYGAGITPEEQRQSIARRGQAQGVLVQIAEQKKQLRELRPLVIQEQQRQAEIESIQEQQRQFEYGRKLGLRGIVPPGLTKTEREGYRAAREELETSKARSEYFSQISKLKEQGLKPIYAKGKLVGFEDVIGMKSIPVESISKLSEQDLTRFEKAGVVELERTNISSGILQTPIPRYQPFFGKVEKYIKYPFQKLADLEDYYQKKVFPGYETGFGVIKERTQSTTERSFGAKASVFAGDVAAFPVYGLKLIETYSFDKEARAEFTALPLLKLPSFSLKRPYISLEASKTLEITNIGLSLTAAYSITKTTRRFLLKPVNIKKEFGLPEQYIAETRIKNIRLGERGALDIAEFKVTAVSPAQRSFQIPKYQAVFSGLREKSLQELSFKKLELLFPTGKVTELRPLRITQSITEPFILRGGRILRATGREGEPLVFTFRGSYKTLTGKTRISRKEFSILSAETYEGKTLRTISPGRKELPTNIRRALEELEKIEAPKGIKAREVFEKELKLDIGGIRIEDIFRLTGKGVKFPKPGKTITRGEVATIQRQLLETKITGKEFGLKEIEYLKEDIGVIDVTFPRFRTPKKVLKIKGIVERFEYEFPSKEPLGVFERMGGTGQKTRLKFGDELNQKAIQKAIGSVGIKLAKTPPRVRIPKVESALQPLEKGISSSFVGTGLYERTEGGQLPGQIQRGLPSYRVRLKDFSRELPRMGASERAINKELSKELTKEVSKEISKELTKQIPKLISKEITKQTNKQITKQIPKLTQKEITKIPRLPRIPGYTPSRGKGKALIPFGLKGEKLPKEFTTGYKPFVLKKGKRIYLGEIALPKGEALRKAEREAKRSLRATFGVQPTKARVRGDNIGYLPSRTLFRGYRIKAGKKYPLKDTYIQKLGKRLSFKGEVAEIQAFRRLKAGKK